MLWATVAGLLLPGVAPGQGDTTAPVVLRPLVVSVARGDLPLDSLPLSATSVSRERAIRGRPTWGLDEALSGVPGVFVANRYNFSLDQRVSIRGFGARSAFALRGIKVVVDGVPQTLPDGQGQLTNLELGTVQRVEVLRGTASALYGNAAGGVISIETGDPPSGGWTQQLHTLAGTFAERRGRTWHKWLLGTAFRVGPGAARLTVGRFVYDGQRDYSAAELRNLAAQVLLPVGTAWTTRILFALGDHPRAENPGALTAAELVADRDAAAPANVAQRAGKGVTQAQGAVTARHAWAGGAELTLSAFGLARQIDNPLSFAWIRLTRRAGGARVVLTRPFGGVRAPHLTVGVDLQEQRDDRVNLANVAGAPDTTRLLDQLERVLEVGPFAQLSVAVAARVRITLGARIDRVHFRATDRLITATNPDDSGERTMAATSGSAGFTWTLAPTTVLHANVGTAFETPTTTELTNRPDGAGGINDSLGPQRAWMLDLGVRWTNSRAQASAAAFVADVRDELVPFEVPTAPQRRFYRNAGRATHAGVELALAAQLRRWLRGSLTYAFADYRYRDFALPVDTGRIVLDGRSLPGVPVHRGQLLLEFRTTAGPWADAEVVGTGSVLVDDTLATRSPGWWLVSVRTGTEVRAGRWRVVPFLGVQNVLNRRYVGSVVINATGGRYYEPAPGRNLYVGLTLGGGR